MRFSAPTGSGADSICLDEDVMHVVLHHLGRDLGHRCRGVTKDNGGAGHVGCPCQLGVPWSAMAFARSRSETMPETWRSSPTTTAPMFASQRLCHLDQAGTRSNTHHRVLEHLADGDRSDS